MEAEGEEAEGVEAKGDEAEGEEAEGEEAEGEEVEGEEAAGEAAQASVLLVWTSQNIMKKILPQKYHKKHLYLVGLACGHSECVDTWSWSQPKIS